MYFIKELINVFIEYLLLKNKNNKCQIIHYPITSEMIQHVFKIKTMNIFPNHQRPAWNIAVSNIYIFRKSVTFKSHLQYSRQFLLFY